MLLLASKSPRRKELLRAAGIEFRVVTPSFDESLLPARGRPADLVRRSALAKASSVAEHRSELVVGADTVVVCDGSVLGKPADRRDACRMLRLLSDRWHSVYTGIAVVSGGRRAADYERTQVAFRRLSKDEIERYVDTGEPMDKAGAYAIQGRGAALVRAIRGCYTNVIGLPMPKLIAMLADFEHNRNSPRTRVRGAR